MLPHQHLHVLSNELSELAPLANTTPKGQRLLHLLQSRIHHILHPPPAEPEQRVDKTIDDNESQQRVINDTPIITIPCITDAPGINQSHNLTAKHTLRTTPHLHRHVTWNNTLGILPGHAVVSPAPILAAVQTYYPRVHSQIVIREAINALTANKLDKCHDIFTTRQSHEYLDSKASIRPKHFACPMVHPVTGQTILSYKKLIYDLVTAETWQTAFGKDFGCMSQEDNKTSQMGTNTMFVMTHDEIHRILATGQKFTNGNPVVDYHPQKEDPSCV
jgi:hypothetical protein